MKSNPEPPAWLSKHSTTELSPLPLSFILSAVNAIFMLPILISSLCSSPELQTSVLMGLDDNFTLCRQNNALPFPNLFFCWFLHFSAWHYKYSGTSGWFLPLHPSLFNPSWNPFTSPNSSSEISTSFYPYCHHLNPGLHLPNSGSPKTF